MTLAPADAERFERTIAGGGIAIFPTDTLYGIACDPDSQAAADRIYELKGRSRKQPSAVMFFSVERLLASLPELDERTRALLQALLPGPYTLIVANPRRRYAPACGETPEKLGLRVPKLAGGAIQSLARVSVPVLQTSANLGGGPDAAALGEIDCSIRAGVDLELDGGSLPGTGSTVADVSELGTGRWRLLRAPDDEASTRIADLVGFPPED
jgi:L-threonylcarbamoyladenylate synthase